MGRYKDENKELWNRCAAFHGHVCGGLTIGYKASLLAMELLEMTFSKDEQIVCIAENDTCSVDAIQVMLGCSIGKGNLLFHMTGKQAFTFFNRLNGKSVRLLLKERPEGLSREDSMAWYQSKEPEELFTVMAPRLQLPERARIFQSYKCDCCGEVTGSNWIRIQDGKKLCVDCYKSYNRFDV